MDGTQSLPQAKRQLAQCLIEDALPIQSIANNVICSRRTVSCYKRNLKDHGSCLAPSISRMGRLPILTKVIIEVQSIYSQKSISILQNPQSVMSAGQIGSRFKDISDSTSRLYWHAVTQPIFRSIELQCQPDPTDLGSG